MTITDDETVLRTVALRIARAAESHVRELAPAAGVPDPGGRTAAGVTEDNLLPKIDDHVNGALVKFDELTAPAVAADLSSTKFFELYDGVGEAAEPLGRSRDPAAERERRRTLVRSLIAAETEIQGRFQLRRNDSVRLAKTLEAVGAGFRNTGMPMHAALAYQSAAEQYRVIRDKRRQGQCQLAEARARNAAQSRRTRKILGTCGDRLAGYGYLPFRLLGWVVVQLLLFSALLWALTPRGVGIVESVHLCLVNFLNPLGLTDTEPLKTPGVWLLVVESYSGTLSLSVFFALLVGRWSIG